MRTLWQHSTTRRATSLRARADSSATSRWIGSVTETSSTTLAFLCFQRADIHNLIRSDIRSLDWTRPGTTRNSDLPSSSPYAVEASGLEGPFAPEIGSSAKRTWLRETKLPRCTARLAEALGGSGAPLPRRRERT